MKMHNPDVIVVGGGIGGLTAAGLLASSGLKVTVLEQGPNVGGYVWGFERNGFYFDATGAFLSACRPGSEFFSIIEKIGIKDISFDPITRIWNIYPDFELRLDYENPSAYLKAVKKHFPQHEKALLSYGRLLDRLGNEFKAFEKAPCWKKVLLPFFFPGLLRYARKSHSQVLNRYFGNDKNVMLALSSLPTTLPPSALSFIFVAVLWAKVLQDGVFYPKGGMKALSNAMAESIMNNGGLVLHNHKVTRILTSNGKATGVALADNREIRARWIIADINPFQGEKMLPAGRRLFGRMHDLRKYRPSLSALLFYIGLKADSLPPDWPYFISIFTNPDTEKMSEALERGSMEKGLHMVITTPTIMDPGLAPRGCHSLKVLAHAPGAELFEARYGKQYSFEKLKKDIFSQIYSHTGLNITRHALFVDKATPGTLFRLTGNEGGAMYGLDAACNQVGPLRPPNRTALDNLLWVGHYTHPAHGIVGSAMSGRFASEIVLSSKEK